MHLLNVFYYHFYLFYTKFDPEPEFATLLSLSFCQSLILNGILDFLSLKFYCYQIAVWVFVLIVTFIILLNYLMFYRNGRIKQIIKAKPTLLNNRALSIIVTLSFFLLTASWLFWGPVLGKNILDHCK